MRKSLNVNLAGRIFVMDEDAYERLDDYFVSVRTCFRNNECGEEIASDIEARMSELFWERMGDGHTGIVDMALVNEMIARVGKPESMLDDDEESGETQSDDKQFQATAKENVTGGNIGKRLYRDGDDKMLGGVISGLSAYLGVDVTLLRIAAVILSFISIFWVFIVYIIAWGIIPIATTTTEKLRMQGVSPTPENIAEKLSGEAPVMEKMLRNVCEVDSKGIAMLFSILACVLVVGIIMCLATPKPYGFFVASAFMSWIAVASLLIIPIVAVMLMFTEKWKAIESSVKWLMLLDWILALMQMVVVL